MSVPRLLTIMGSGETSPTMVKVHRQLLERSGLPAVVLDTPVGFQENAGEITAKAVAYFRESVGEEIGVATYRSASAADAVTTETFLARVREARYVFAGPGSPSYALEQWRTTSVPQLLAEKLRSGGAITFASAAALTVGTHTVPVYEIYKVGEDPHWLPGLDLLAEANLRAAVIPHYDNAEGGSHDTRYSYLGERRLELMEEQLPEDVFVLGVDEHTACILDLEGDTATVTGLGAVTVRRKGRSSTVDAGTTVALQQWRDGNGEAATTRSGHEYTPKERVDVPRSRPFVDEVESSGRRFDEALVAGDARAAVEAVLQLEDLMTAWANETFSADEADTARAALRSMVTRLGEAAGTGLRDPKATVGPYVEALIEARDRARDGKRFDEADAIRDRLGAEGIEIRDNPAGTDWELDTGK